MKHATTTMTFYGQFAGLVRRYAFAVSTIIIFTSLFAFSVFYLLRESRLLASQIIATDVAQLATIFKKIDEQCKIVDFDHQKNYIDFLTVEKFTGSQIGSMDLMLPKNWQGPYVKENPTVQGKVYHVVRTKKGYFIVPADGIKLANGKVIGRDIILDEYADIDEMSRSAELLMHDGKPLAVRVPIGGISVTKERALAFSEGI